MLVTLTPELECSEDRVCISKSNCSYWLEREERYKEGQDDTFISEVREQICNRQQQALCCPRSGESLISELKSYCITLHMIYFMKESTPQ